MDNVIDNIYTSMTNIYRWTQVAIQKKKKLKQIRDFPNLYFVCHKYSFFLLKDKLKEQFEKFGLQIYFRLDIYF